MPGENFCNSASIETPELICALIEDQNQGQRYSSSQEENRARVHVCHDAQERRRRALSTRLKYDREVDIKHTEIRGRLYSAVKPRVSGNDSSIRTRRKISSKDNSYGARPLNSMIARRPTSLEERRYSGRDRRKITGINIPDVLGLHRHFSHRDNRRKDSSLFSFLFSATGIFRQANRCSRVKQFHVQPLNKKRSFR